jgi:hypothetical protein
VGGATDGDDDAAGVDPERRERSSHRDGSRRGCRRRSGRSGRKPSDRGRSGCGRRLARRDRCRREQRLGRRDIGAAPVRHDLHAMHVRQGQPDTAQRLPVHVHSAARCHAARAAPRSASTAAWTAAATPARGSAIARHSSTLGQTAEAASAISPRHPAPSHCSARRFALKLRQLFEPGHRDRPRPC